MTSLDGQQAAEVTLRGPIDEAALLAEVGSLMRADPVFPPPAAAGAPALAGGGEGE
ncbi:MAG: hypothetical protein OHK0022_47110 [Roseiflexaceae bacterium]